MAEESPEKTAAQETDASLKPLSPSPPPKVEAAKPQVEAAPDPPSSSPSATHVADSKPPPPSKPPLKQNPPSESDAAAANGASREVAAEHPLAVAKDNDENSGADNSQSSPPADPEVHSDESKPSPPPPPREEAKVASRPSSSSQSNIAPSSAAQPNAQDDINWVEQRKMDLLTKQAERTTLLHKQKQVIMASAEKDRKNLQKCQSRFDAMVERLDSARQTAQELYDFLSARQKTANRTAADMTSTETVFASRESGTIRQAAVAQDHVALNLVEHQKETNEQVFTPAIARCLQFTKDTKQRLNFLRSEGSKVTKALEESKTSLDKAWANYELSMSKSVHLASQGKIMDTDPFLVAREYQLAQQAYKKVEEVYSVSMAKLFREVATADGRRIDEMKAILLDWFLAEKALVQNQSKLIDTALSYIKAIDREKDVNSFIRNGEFVFGPKNQTVFEALPKGLGTKEISDLFYKDIMKHGTLCRQGRLIASNWKKMFAIITRSGFFHCYDSKAAALPLYSIRLDCVNVAMKEGLGDFVFEVAEPNRSIFSLTGNPTRYCFKADSEEMMVDWITEIKKHLAE